jgi:Kdo2-lipid IVA lauroyltransferase/acyltransferase
MPTLSRKKRFERAAGRVGLRLVVGPLRALPLPLARAVGRGVGIFLYGALQRYRRVAHKNLALVYGAKVDARSRSRMARAVFVHFGQSAAEFVKMPQLTRAEVDVLCQVEGEENLCRALEGGLGVLLITGHFGNWEFMARWLTTHGYPLNVVARRANDPQADRLLTDTRTGGGAQVYNRGSSARAVLQCLRRKEIVGLLPDQNAGNVFVPFLGQRTGTVDGPAILHLRTGAPLLFSWCVRTPDNRFQITFEAPVVVGPTGDRNADIAAVMTLINARLEAQIYQNPTQWLWLHDRWKSSPGVFDRSV